MEWIYMLIRLIITGLYSFWLGMGYMKQKIGGE